MVMKNCLIAFEKFWAKAMNNFTEILLLMSGLDAIKLSTLANQVNYFV